MTTAGTARRTIYVVPCFEEAKRLEAAPFSELVADERVGVIAVDDGSKDATRGILERIAAGLGGHMQVLALEHNRGKGEAVRAGLLAALGEGAAIVGYADADFATPPSELLRLLDELEQHRVEVVLGARILRLGADIRRNELRHYAGRVFATFSARTVGVPIYDTQCGAKLFRRSAALEAALSEPLSSRWSFDVELLARLFGRLPTEAGATIAPSQVLEVPLRQWHDIGGSKLHLPGMVRAFADLLGLFARAELGAIRQRRASASRRR